MNWTPILISAAIFAGMGIVLGALLAVASRVFAVKVDERVPKIQEALPGANCGGCGYSGCAALAEAIVKGEADPGACTVGGAPVAKAIGTIMGVEAKAVRRMRAQVMCCGTTGVANKKYDYVGAADCIAAERLGGGGKSCPNGCLGLGSCAAVCPVGAISIVDGVAFVDKNTCVGCGKCESVCPKHVIRMIPYDTVYYVGCTSVETGKATRESCGVGCISCRICEKNCPTGAITVNNFVASIRYDQCTACGLCEQKCPRHIIKKSC
ncbi:MAG: RnfABCDGE type electron transport complex subunit B [Clostridia bacterium]|nr:RnfABCDGE type electron transport complex subunit B [Clostridia bacterium]